MEAAGSSRAACPGVTGGTGGDEAAHWPWRRAPVSACPMYARVLHDSYAAGGLPMMYRIKGAMSAGRLTVNALRHP